MDRHRARAGLIPPGFALVTALVDDPDDANQAPAEPASRDEAAEAESPTPPAVEAAPPPQSDETTGAATVTSEGDSAPAGEGGGGRSDWPASLSPGTIEVDYGRWDDLFELESPELLLEIGLASVTGELRYLGGAGCLLGRVKLRGRFYDRAGGQIGAGARDSTWVTGEGAEFPQREPLYLGFYGEVGEAAEAAYLRFVDVECL